MNTKKKKKKTKPLVTIKSSRYQPTKAELEESVHIPISPEQLAEVVTSTVKIKSEKV